MRVLVTGATGYIGGATAAAAAAAGHQVIGMAHDRDAERRLTAAGLNPVRGDLRDADSLRRAAEGVDAVIHAANTGGADAAEVDTSATRVLLEAMRASGGRLIYTSGIWVLGPTCAGVADEGSPRNPIALVAWRADLEVEVLRPGIQGRGLAHAGIVLRPAIAYGGAGGIPAGIAAGTLPVVGDGRQAWPLVHVDDLADLYVRALAAPGGSILHGVAASATPRDIALLGQVRGRAPSGPHRIPLEEARAKLGYFADALALHQSVSAVQTRRLTGWAPRAPSVTEELLGEAISDAA